MAKGTPGGDLVSSGSRYVDRVVRTDDGWRIASREMRNIWRGGNLRVLELGRAAVGELRPS
jgi:hypothetical protein